MASALLLAASWLVSCRREDPRPPTPAPRLTKGEESGERARLAKGYQLGILQIWSGEVSTPALHVSSAELDADGCPEILLGSQTWHLLDRGCRGDAPWRESRPKLGRGWGSLLALQGGGAAILTHDADALRLECGRIGHEGWEPRDESSVSVVPGFDPVAASWAPSAPGQLVVAANGARPGLLVYAARDCALRLLSRHDTSEAQIFDFEWIGPPGDRRACSTLGASTPLPWVECAAWPLDPAPRYQQLGVGWAFAPDLLITPESHAGSTSQLNRVSWTGDEPDLAPLPSPPINHDPTLIAASTSSAGRILIVRGPPATAGPLAAMSFDPISQSWALREFTGPPGLQGQLVSLHPLTQTGEAAVLAIIRDAHTFTAWMIRESASP